MAWPTSWSVAVNRSKPPRGLVGPRAKALKNGPWNSLDSLGVGSRYHPAAVLVPGVRPLVQPSPMLPTDGLLLIVALKPPFAEPPVAELPEASGRFIVTVKL